LVALPLVQLLALLQVLQSDHYQEMWVRVLQLVQALV
jgi:hypothetical protein